MIKWKYNVLGMNFWNQNLLNKVQKRSKNVEIRTCFSTTWKSGKHLYSFYLATPLPVRLNLLLYKCSPMGCSLPDKCQHWHICHCLKSQCQHWNVWQWLRASSILIFSETSTGKSAIIWQQTVTECQCQHLSVNTKGILV